MDSDPNETRVTLFCLPLPRFGKKGRRKTAVRPEGCPTPVPPEERLELELAEESARVEKPEADEFAEKRQLEDELRVLKERLETREKDVADREASIQRLQKDVSKIQTKVTEQQSAAARVQELSARLEEKEQLLSERTMELSAAQAFLTRVDAVSEKEVVGMVRNINTLISSISGALDSWDERDPMLGAVLEELEVKQIRDTFGNLVSEQIMARNQVAVSLAVQASLGYFIERVTSGWGGGRAAGTLGEIHEMISSKEGQAIASRWRTLTKRYLPHQELLHDEEIMVDLARILTTTRAFPNFSEAMEFVRDSAGGDIKVIVETTLQFDNTIKTMIASCDMSVYTVPPGTVFDDTKMVDEFGKDGTKRGGERRIVVGTTEIGLLQKLGNVEKILKKPKVILEEDLVAPEGES